METNPACGGDSRSCIRDYSPGCLIWNVSDGALKRHAGGYAWEIGIGADTSAKVGLHGVMPTGQRAGADQATATDLASVITLPNELRAALVEKGLIKGGV